MDLLLFCEWLIHRSVFENDYAADMTLHGILHFLGVSRNLALKDNDMEEYMKFRNLSDKIYITRDSQRNIKKLQEVS